MIIIIVKSALRYNYNWGESGLLTTDKLKLMKGYGFYQLQGLRLGDILRSHVLPLSSPYNRHCDIVRIECRMCIEL